MSLVVKASQISSKRAANLTPPKWRTLPALGSRDLRTSSLSLTRESRSAVCGIAIPVAAGGDDESPISQRNAPRWREKCRPHRREPLLCAAQPSRPVFRSRSRHSLLASLAGATVRSRASTVHNGSMPAVERIIWRQCHCSRFARARAVRSGCSEERTRVS